MNTFSHVPPGFRFHPTDEELVDYYLRKKIASKKIDLDVIRDVDLYKIEPWDLQELCKIGSEDQNEWYFFSHKDKKYPTGTRTNRATKAGFWKATGRDKAIYIRHNLVGMRKTLVFYKGRAPNGQKSDWIMHEYRLETNENGPPQEEGWVVCRVFKKRLATVRRMGDYESPCWYDQSSSFMPELDSPRTNMFPNPAYTTTSSSSSYHQQLYSNCKQELDHHLQYNAIPVPPHPDSFLQLPQLESPKVAQYGTYDHHLRNNGCHVMPSSTFRQIGEFLTNLLHHSSAMTSKKLQRKQQQITRMKQYLIPWVMKCIRVWEPTNPRGRKILLHRTMPPQHPPQVAKLIFGNEIKRKNIYITTVSSPYKILITYYNHRSRYSTSKEIY